MLNDWTAVCLSETWRAEPSETWGRPDYGQQFIGSGGTLGQRGVAIILHKTYTKYCHASRRVNELICHVDLHLPGDKVRLISVYVPDGTFSDKKVAEVHEQLSKAITKGKDKGYKILAAGDWNAVVGQQVEDESSAVIGKHGHGGRNARGQWLVNFATEHLLCIVNNIFRKKEDKLWTHEMNHVRLQLDYAVVDRRMRTGLRDAEVCYHFTTGVDHRSVAWSIGSGHKKQQRATNGCKRIKLIGWTQSSQEAFQRSLDSRLCPLPMQGDIEQRYAHIESAVGEVAWDCGIEQASKHQSWEECRQELQRPIGLRKEAKRRGYYAAVTLLSKQIHKEARRSQRSIKREKVRAILQEHKGLKSIAGILDCKKQSKISCVKDQAGSDHADPQEIVDCFG